MKIKLPETPVDRYVVEFYSTTRDRVEHCRIEYHANTPWKTFAPDGGMGVEIVDEWMHFVEGRCMGRSERWECPAKREWENCYETRVEAVAALRASLTKRAVSREEEAMELRQRIAEIDG